MLTAHCRPTPRLPSPPLAPDISWHIATLSKCVSPGLRIAYVAVPGTNEAVRLAAELRAINMMASPLTAALASQWIAEGELDTVVAAIPDGERSQAGGRT